MLRRTHLNRPTAYAGSEPYVFVAYSHRDAAEVYDEILELQTRGVNVTYDDGISPGSVWSNVIADRIARCDWFVYFVSPDSVRSEYCQRELNFALEERRRVLPIYLRETEVPGGVRLNLTHRQAIKKHALSASAYRERVMAALRPGAPAAAPAAAPLLNDEIDVEISCQADDSSPDLRRLGSGVLRYISWQGGLYRVHDARGSPLHTAAIDFRIELSARRIAETVELDWQVSRAPSGEIVWANRTTESADSYAIRADHLAEVIAEGALQTIADHELQRIAGQDPAGLSFYQLLIKARQLNYFDRQQVQDRSKTLDRALELRPDSALAHAELAGLLSWKIINGLSGDTAADTGRLEREARAALRLAGNDPAVLLSVGTTYCRIGRYQQGLSLLRRSYRMAPTVAAKDQLARSLCFAGRPEEAIELFAGILETLPAGHTFPYARLAVALTQSGRLEDALARSSEAVVHFAEDFYGWLLHANLLALLNRTDEAREALAEARRLVPKLQLDNVIERTESTYGRTPEQRHWLTGGLRALRGD